MSTTTIPPEAQGENSTRRSSSSSQGDQKQSWHQSTSGVEPPLPNRQMAYAQPTAPTSLAQLDLGFLPKASASQYSLLEAVVGPNHAQYAQPTPAPARPSGSSIHSGSRVPSSSEEATSFGTSTEKSWDVLSDASLKVNREDDQDMAELQKKVDKRKSKLPALEGELAALEARIKEAEERLARAQAGSGSVQTRWQVHVRA